MTVCVIISSFWKKCGPITSIYQMASYAVILCWCNGLSTVTCVFLTHQVRQFYWLIYSPSASLNSMRKIIIQTLLFNNGQAASGFILAQFCNDGEATTNRKYAIMCCKVGPNAMYAVYWINLDLLGHFHFYSSNSFSRPCISMMFRPQNICYSCSFFKFLHIFAFIAFRWTVMSTKSSFCKGLSLSNPLSLLET